MIETQFMYTMIWWYSITLDHFEQNTFLLGLLKYCTVMSLGLETCFSYIRCSYREKVLVAVLVTQFSLLDING